MKTARGERRALLLHDVAYIVELDGDQANFVAGPTQVADADERPRCHLGLPEFGAELTVIAGKGIPRSALHGTGTHDLGWLPRQNRGGKIHYLRTTMVDGVIDMTNQDSGLSGA